MRFIAPILLAGLLLLPSAPVAAQDEIQFTCLHQPPLLAEIGQDFILEANFPEYHRIRSVVLFIRYQGEREFSAFPVMRIAGDLYRAAVPADELRGSYLEYYFRIADKKGNETNVCASPRRPKRIRIKGGAPSGVTVREDSPPSAPGWEDDDDDPADGEAVRTWEPIVSGEDADDLPPPLPPPPGEEAPGAPITGTEELDEVFAVYGAEDVVVSASKREQKIGEAPAAIFVLTKEDLRYSGVSSIVEALRMAPGVEIYHINPSNITLGMRGLTTEMNNLVLVLIDGREVNVDLFGQTFWEALPISIEEIERIEVMRGPGSTLHGANAYSGVINIITRRQKTDGLSAIAAVRVGSVGTITAHGSVYGKSGAFTYAGSAGYDSMNAWWNSDYNAKDVARGRFFAAFELMEDMELSLELGLVQVQPGAESREYAEERRLARAFNRTDDVAEQGRINREYEKIIDNEYRGGNKIYSTIAEIGVEALQTYTTLAFSYSGLEFRAYWNHLDAQLGFIGLEPIELGTAAVGFDAGALYFPQRLQGSGETIDGEVLYTTPEGVIPYNRLTIGANGRVITYTGTNIVPDDHMEKRGGVLLEDELKFVDWMLITAGLRLDFNDITPATVDGISPRANLSFNPYEEHYLRVGFGSAFRKPSFLEAAMHLDVEFIEGSQPIAGLKENLEKLFVDGIGNEDLDNEKVYSLEFGYLGFVWDRRIRLNLDFFYTWYRDFVEFEYKLDGMDIAFSGGEESYVQFLNTGNNAEAYGLEIGIEARPADVLKLFANFSWLHIEQDNEVDEDGNPRPKQEREETKNPAYKLNLGGRLSLDIGFNMSLWINWVSEYNKSARNPDSLFSFEEGAENWVWQKLGNVVMLNARIGWRFLDDRLEIGVEGWNLLGGAEPYGYPRQFPGRSETVDVDLSSVKDERNIGNFGGERMNLRIVGFVRLDY